VNGYNQYSFYSLNTNIKSESSKDKIERCVNDLRQINEYYEVLDYLNANFSNFQSGKIIDFPELNKQICITLKGNAIEVHVAKNRQQFFSKGWLLIQKEESKENDLSSIINKIEKSNEDL